MDARQQAWMAAQSSLQQLMSSKLRLQAELINAKYQAATSPNTARNEIDELKGKISTIDQSIATSEARHAIQVRAPRAGVVTAIAAQAGQAVSRGARLLTIVPSEGTMVGQLLAPSAAVGFVHPGEHVLMRYAGFPYQKFGQYDGTVESVSRAALSGEEVQQWPTARTPASPASEFYEVTVLPDHQTVSAFGGEVRIPANMQVNAYVLLDKRPLYQSDPGTDLQRAPRLAELKGAGQCNSPKGASMLRCSGARPRWCCRRKRLSAGWHAWQWSRAITDAGWMFRSCVTITASRSRA